MFIHRSYSSTAKASTKAKRLEGFNLSEIALQSDILNPECFELFVSRQSPPDPCGQ